MTTSWSHATRGQFGAAFEAHVAGTLLAVAAAVGSGWALALAAGGKWLLRKPSEALVVALVVAAAGLVACEWVVRLLAG